LPTPDATIATRPPTLVSERPHDLAAFHAGQDDDGLIVDDRKICRFPGEVAQLAQIRHGLRHEVAATREGRPDGEALRADVPLGFIAVELHEAALFQGRQQTMDGRGRQAGADGKIAEPISLIVFGKGFDNEKGAVYRLHAAVPRIGVVVGAGFRLDQPAPDHVSLHRDLHSS
jgi:hypothetical protein